MKHDNSSLEINQQERIKSLVQVENYKYWLGGFVEGEGALVVSIAKNAKVTHGLALQPRNYSTNTRLLNNNQKVDQQAPISLFQLDGADKIRRLFIMC
jgi:hypothetical protein